MKKTILIACAALFTSACASVKVGGEISSLAFSDTTVTIGAKFHAKGTQNEIASKADSLAKGYPVMIAGQWFQIRYSATDVELNTILNFKTK